MTDPKGQAAALKIPGYPSIDTDAFISHFEGCNNYTLVFAEGVVQPLLTSRSLLYFEGQLPHFIRISKSHLINPAYVDSVSRTGRLAVTLTLRGGARLVISRRRTPASLLRIWTYQQERSS
ncbi:LytTR family DNA-binding domain-containing protein [Fibrella forsythiae]|uniref:LytTR family transcriptional regulator DNA-binding domain-containing protein n=1 Tax=Fibrella forsythiae TaxID=2817061 RepID=A0ABS3JUT0_9BACT|nr:LytTR family DNA-binding domain-containing protein [Fibrella forsythiae]MBO0953131.1 LytTR family transcriptional regulator DNA-binding domain-containing protein [Fibrella forsythiae]